MQRRRSAAFALVFTCALLGRVPPTGAQGLPCSQCGPGPHWVDNCLIPFPPVPTLDTIASTGGLAAVDIIPPLDCIADLNLILGPCPVPDDLLTVQKFPGPFFPGPVDDSAFFPGTSMMLGLHFDVIDTEIVSMCLTDGLVTLRAGQLAPSMLPLLPSQGAIVERSPESLFVPPFLPAPIDPLEADSFFDVFFEVNVGGTFLYNQIPQRVTTVVDCLPPAASYLHITGCTPLFTNTVGGNHIANLVAAQHNVNTGNHFKCYKTKRFPFSQRTVNLEDQFGSTMATVVKPDRFCNPVDKEGEGMADPTHHLNCYKIREATPAARDVVMTNQFGQQKLTIKRAETLCLPAEKNGVPTHSTRHYKCYRARRARGEPRFTTPDVLLADQFESRVTTVLKPFLVCAPVDKNDEDPAAPASLDHLTCFKIKDAPGQPRFLPVTVRVTDQFIMQTQTQSQRTDCGRTRYLCVPSMKQIASPSGAFIEMGGSLIE